MELPLEEECNAWLLSIEGNLDNSSVTLDAVQWAIACLQKSELSDVGKSQSALQNKANYGGNKKVYLGFETSAQRESNDQKKKETHISSSQVVKVVYGSKKRSHLHENYGTRTTDLNVAPDYCQEGMSIERERHMDEIDRLSHMDGAVSESGMHMNVDDDYIGENIRVCDRGGAGYNVASIIGSRLNLSSPLVNLIEHCLLVSLDQDKPSHLNQAKIEHPWLHLWVFKHTFSSGTINCQIGILRDLDWLLAYLSGASPNLFIPMLLDAVAGEISSKRSNGETVPISTLVRMANIMEYMYLRNEEFAAYALISSYDLLAKNLKTPLSSYASGLIGIWFIMGFLCPSLFCSCINLLILTPTRTSVQRWWSMFQSCDVEALPLSDIYSFVMDANSNKRFSLDNWLCAILRRRLNLLSVSASDIILALGDLCTDSGYQEMTDMVPTAQLLLEVISKEAYGAMLQKITEGDDTSESLLENLRHHIMKLWNEVLKKRYISKRYMENPCLYDDPILYICLSILLCCKTCIRSQIFVHSTRFIYSFEEERCSTYKLEFLLRAMQILSGKDESQDMFQLWAENLVRQACTLPPDQAYHRILVVLNILKLSSSGDSVLGFSEAIDGSSKGWIPVCYHLCKALNTQWLRLLSLLHWENAWDLGMMVLSLLQFLSSENIYNFKDLIPRLKGSLGLLFSWLDEAYGYERAESAEVDEKWKSVQLIEKLKTVIVQLSSANQMSFMVMANSILDYSFYGVRGYFPETTSARIQGTRLNCYGRQSLQPPVYNARHHRNQPKNARSLITAQLGSLLRKTVGSVQKSAAGFQPCLLLVKLLVHRLETPTEGPVTREQYEEVFPKSLPSSRNVFLASCFSKNRLLFEILEIVLEKGDCNTNTECLELMRSLLAHNITFWYSGYAIEKSHTPDSSMLGDEETDRVQVCRLIQMISMTGWIPKPLASSSEIVSVIEREDISEILLLIWRCMHDQQQNNSKDSDKIDADGSEEEWEGQYFSILRRNVARLGPHFSHLYPKKSF